MSLDAAACERAALSLLDEVGVVGITNTLRAAEVYATLAVSARLGELLVRVPPPDDLATLRSKLQ